MHYSFLMIGQSNMAGRGFIGDVPPIINDRIKMLRNGRWQMMAEPINYDRPVAGVGLASSFAALWCRDNNEDEIGLIPCAEGGSTLEEWQPGGALFEHAILQAKLAMKLSTLSGILWHQGESDSLNGKWQVYYSQLKMILDTFRERLGAQELPLIIGGLPDFLGKSGFGLSCVEHEKINACLQKFADNEPHTYFVSAEGLTSNPDGIHIDAGSQRIFGVRYYEAFSKRMHITESLVDEADQLAETYARPQTTNEAIFVASRTFAEGKMTFEDFMTTMQKIQSQA